MLKCFHLVENSTVSLLNYVSPAIYLKNKDYFEHGSIYPVIFTADPLNQWICFFCA